MLRLHLITVAIAFGEFFGVFSPIIVVFVVIQIRPCGYVLMAWDVMVTLFLMNLTGVQRKLEMNSLVNSPFKLLLIFLTNMLAEFSYVFTELSFLYALG